MVIGGEFMATVPKTCKHSSVTGCSVTQIHWHMRSEYIDLYNCLSFSRINFAGIYQSQLIQSYNSSVSNTDELNYCSVFDAEISGCNCIRYSSITDASVYDTAHFWTLFHPIEQSAHCALVAGITQEGAIPTHEGFVRHPGQVDRLLPCTCPGTQSGIVVHLGCCSL